MKIIGLAILFLITVNAASAEFTASAQGGECIEIWSIWDDHVRHEVNLDSGAVISRQTPQVMPASDLGKDSPNGRYNAHVEQETRRLILTDRERGISVTVAENAGGAVWSPDNVWMAYLQFGENRRDEDLTIYNLASGERITNSLTHNDLYSVGIDWSPDGRLIALSYITDVDSQQSAIELFSIPTLMLTQTIPTSVMTASALWSPDARTIAATTTYDNFALIDVQTGAMTEVVIGGYYEAEWSSDGRYLLIRYGFGDLGQEISVFDARGEIVVDDAWVGSDHWVNDHQVLAGVSTDIGLDDLTLFDLVSREQRVIQSQIVAYSLSSDGRYVATTDMDGRLKIFDLTGEKTAQQVDTPNPIRSLIWRDDAQMLVALFEDRLLRVYDFGEWRMVAEIPGEEWMLRHVSCGTS